MATRCNSFTDSDLELAMKLQAEEYSKSSFTIPISSSHHPRLGNVASILTDAAIAAELQAEENAQSGLLIRSTVPSLHRYQQLSGISIRDDAAIAAELQAEENAQQGLLIRSMAPSVLHRRQLNAPWVNNDEFIAIRLQPEDYVEEQLQTIPRESSDHCHHSPEVPFDFHSFQTYFDDLQHRQDDFTPNDYERLRELDGEEQQPKLNSEQIDQFPTETFVPRANQSEQETTCTVCCDKYEAKDIIRRLPCLHTYHRDCIDRWLKTKSECPICRVNPHQH